MKRVIVFSDSIGRARPNIDENERTYFEDVYGYLLRQHLESSHEVEICYFDSLDSEDAVFLSERQVAFRGPDIVIIHLGVVDCAPRIFGKGSKSIIFRSWFPFALRRLILGFISRGRYWITKYIVRGIVYTQPDRFRQNLEQIRSNILDANSECKILAISISPTIRRINARSWGFNANVAAYNGIIRSVFPDEYIDITSIMDGEPDQYLLSDGIHLTKESHAELASYLAETIQKFG